ncbi:MAG: hypothetical protein HYY17_03700 [Planctomycetes bacterium]|nr:hypothetical protein [Planctomycetota bacterium]
MRREGWKAILSRSDFRPLEITIGSGERYAIRHPESVSVLLRNVVIDSPDGLIVIFEIDDLTSVRLLPRNGCRRS